MSMRALLYVILVSTSLQCELDTVYMNGTIHTLDPMNIIVQAIGVCNGRITIRGTNQEVLQQATRSTGVHNLQGSVVLPGFIDGHSHVGLSGLVSAWANLNSPPVGRMRQFSEVFDSLASLAHETPANLFVMGWGYDNTQLAEMRHLTMQELDRVSTVHPIVVVHVSFHLVVANTVAFERLGFNVSQPFSINNDLVPVNAMGYPTGLLLESEAVKAIGAGIVQLTEEQWLNQLAGATKQYARHGITTSQEGFAAKEVPALFHMLDMAKRLHTRVNIWPRTSLLEDVPQLKLYNSDWLQVQACKHVVDGSIQGYTAYLREPYHTPAPFAMNDTQYRGQASVSLEDLTAFLVRSNQLGVQVALHTNGDAGIDLALDAWETAQAQAWRPDARLILVHAQMAREDQLDRMATLAVIPSFFVLHTLYFGDRHRDQFLGETRAAVISPLASSQRRGIPFNIHTDAPISPPDIFPLLRAAVERTTMQGHVLGPDERITVREALRAVTINAAYQTYQEADLGSLEVGKFADFVVLSRDPLSVQSAHQLTDIEVLATFVGGQNVYNDHTAQYLSERHNLTSFSLPKPAIPAFATPCNGRTCPARTTPTSV
eukprot:NODE_263_length_2183_cov_86.025778_g257_i0.p1 GENE.NODE_263_length_2183_cov_86.025778_g257_i0~~NODE_263_length_2183_cov_86.025778_g257_i0.p1  ORF type:complete len:601 (-),score=95.93 NODE_263_length_2183_cov_86.025778_g257_i0:310-2112(-)